MELLKIKNESDCEELATVDAYDPLNGQRAYFNLAQPRPSASMES